MSLTKVEVVAQFRSNWREFIKENRSWRGDSVAKRESFNNFVDALNKDGDVTDWQANNWSNPF